MGKIKDMFDVVKYRKKYNTLEVKYTTLLEKYNKMLEEDRTILNDYLVLMEKAKNIKKETEDKYKSKYKKVVSRSVKNNGKGKK